MPTILRKEGFRFFFYSQEGNEPPHIHVQYGKGVAKFWITDFTLANNKGLNGSELKKASNLVMENNELFLEKWNEFFSK